MDNATDRKAYMEFHASIKSTDPAYLMLVEDAEKINRIEAARIETPRKAAYAEHRRTVNKEVVTGLVVAGLTESQAKKVITAIVGGLVNHVRINY